MFDRQLINYRTISNKGNMCIYLPAKYQLEEGLVVNAWHAQPVSVQNICVSLGLISIC